MTDQSVSPDSPVVPGESGESSEPATGRAVLLAFAFAVFAAWVAADFATGGKLTAWAAATLAGLRGRGEETT